MVYEATKEVPTRRLWRRARRIVVFMYSDRGCAVKRKRKKYQQPALSPLADVDVRYVEGSGWAPLVRSKTAERGDPCAWISCGEPCASEGEAWDLAIHRSPLGDTDPPPEEGQQSEPA